MGTLYFKDKIHNNYHICDKLSQMYNIIENYTFVIIYYNCLLIN